MFTASEQNLMIKVPKIVGSVLLAGVSFSSAFGQIAQPEAKSELVGTWNRGHEDYQEFIYHKVERFTFQYLKENPDSKMIARLCSKEKTMAVALASSYGFAYSFPRYGTFFKTPSDRFYFARSSKCPNKSEQYWFVPPTENIDFDELIPAEKVSVRRWITADDHVAGRQATRKEFYKHLKEFIADLKKNPTALGFVIQNRKSSARFFKESLRQIRVEKIEKARIQVIRKDIYKTYYPEFISVIIQD